MKLSFVSYSGEYPNLCAGTLVLAIDGKPISFPCHCLSSGGFVNIDDCGQEEIEEGLWHIDVFPPEFPDSLKEAATKLVNKHVPYGRCGGCV